VERKKIGFEEESGFLFDPVTQDDDVLFGRVFLPKRIFFCHKRSVAAHQGAGAF